MHFFGSSKKHDNNTQDVADMNSASVGGYHDVQPTNYPPRLPGAGMANGDAFGQTQTSFRGPHYDNHSAGNPFHHSAQDDPYSASGVGSGRQSGWGQGTQPADANNHGASQTRSSVQGAEGHLAGNFEPATGPMVGSDALKLKLAQKEQEAEVIRLQGGELAEAERLEHEARVRREHAVAHGANPEHSTLGIGNLGAGAGHGPVVC